MPDFLLGEGGRALLVFLGLGVGLGGFAAFGMGRALAANWRMAWLAAVYSVPLAAAMRFLHYALFDEPLVSGRSYAATYAVVAGFAWLGFKLTRARQMKRLYGFTEGTLE